MRQLIDQMRVALEVDDITRHLALDLALHLCLADASGNPLLKYLVKSLRETTASAIREVQNSTDLPQTLADQAVHEEIVAAIAVGDVMASRRAMRKHFDDALARTRPRETAGAPASSKRNRGE